MTIARITIPDIQFSGAITLEKLRRLNDEFKRIGNTLNLAIDEINALLSAEVSGVESHVLATASGLGDEHTISGAESGQVLKATGAESALFAFLTFAELAQTDAATFLGAEHGDVLQFWDGYYSMRPFSSAEVAPSSAEYLISVSNAGLPNGRVVADTNTVAFSFAAAGVASASVVAGSISRTYLDRAYARDFMLMGG